MTRGRVISVSVDPGYIEVDVPHPTEAMLVAGVQEYYDMHGHCGSAALVGAIWRAMHDVATRAARDDRASPFSDGYTTAYYELAAMLGLDYALPMSPAEAHEMHVKPALRKLLDKQAIGR